MNADLSSDALLLQLTGLSAEKRSTSISVKRNCVVVSIENRRKVKSLFQVPLSSKSKILIVFTYTIVYWLWSTIPSTSVDLNMLIAFSPFPQMSSKRSSSFRRAIANGRRTLQREILLDETGLGLYKRFVRYVAYEILPCETDRRWYFHQNRLCPPPVFIAIVTIVQVRFRRWRYQQYRRIQYIIDNCTGSDISKT